MSNPFRLFSRVRRLAFESLESRLPMAFSIVEAEVHQAGFQLIADFNRPVDALSLHAEDLSIGGTQTAISVMALDADSVAFALPSLADGNYGISIGAGAIVDTTGAGLEPFFRSYAIANTAQYLVKHYPRLQLGNAPLVGYPGSEMDRVDLLWQTMPANIGIQDTFQVQYRAFGDAAWQSTALNATIATGVGGRVVWSASISGLNWNSPYEYRVTFRRGDVIVQRFQDSFRTRIAAGDPTPFSFAAYGDSADSSASGFREVQARINAVDPAFSVLLGDNVYSVGSHDESDGRFDPLVNPEAAEWMASHIDYLGLGNHDVGTSSGLPSEQNFSVPIPVAGVTAPAAPPATERPEHSFSWDYGNVHFVTFDTNSYTSTSRLDGLLKWVVTDLNASTARWKIVYGHHPLAGVPDKPESPNGNYYQQVVNRLKAAGVDLFMTGHSHTYSWTYPLTGQINGTATYANHGVDDHFHTGEGLTQLVSGVGGIEIRTGDYNQFPFVAEGFTSTTPIAARLGFSKIEVTPDVLTVNYVAADDGQVIDSFRLQKDDVQTRSFQQTKNGYLGAVDTYLSQNLPDSTFGVSPSLKVDADDPAGTGLDAQGLLRFEQLFGSEANQIPSDAILRSATLQLNVTNGSVNNMNLHRMMKAWTASETWNSLANGLQLDGVEALAAPDTSSGTSQVGTLSFNVLSSLEAWKSDPSKNFGWAIMPTGSDGIDFSSSDSSLQPKLIVTYVSPSQVLNRNVFYNRSTSAVFGNGTGNPINAIDPSKSALLPGQSASFANYTNYARGLNGLLIDIANFPNAIDEASFQFATWDGIDSIGFAPTAATPTFSLLPGVGTAGSNRLKIEFADGAIRNTWLRVTVLANPFTRLSANEVFYFGNAVGDMNLGNFGTPLTIRTNAIDTAAVRQNQSTPPNSVDITSIYDLNKDGRVNSIDTSIVRQNQSNSIIRLFNAPLSFVATANFPVAAWEKIVAYPTMIPPIDLSSHERKFKLTARGAEHKLGNAWAGIDGE